MLTAEAITDALLHDLFAMHCACRPLDLHRAGHEHSHGCDVGILDDIQTALFSPYGEEACGARYRCAALLNDRSDKQYGLVIEVCHNLINRAMPDEVDAIPDAGYAKIYRDQEAAIRAMLADRDELRAENSRLVDKNERLKKLLSRALAYADGGLELLADLGEHEDEIEEHRQDIADIRSGAEL